MTGSDDKPRKEGILSGPYNQNATLQVKGSVDVLIPAGTSVLLKGANPARMMIAVYAVTLQDQVKLTPFQLPTTAAGVVPTTYPDPVIWHVAALPGIAIGDVWGYSFSGGTVRVIEVVTKTIR